jgi:predicted dehydrogenase
VQVRHLLTRRNADPPLAKRQGMARVDQIKDELTAFLDSVRTRQRPSANVTDAGVVLAEIMEALYESARVGQPVSLKASA